MLDKHQGAFQLAEKMVALDLGLAFYVSSVILSHEDIGDQSKGKQLALEFAALLFPLAVAAKAELRAKEDEKAAAQE